MTENIQSNENVTENVTINQRIRILIDALGLNGRRFGMLLGIKDGTLRNYIDRGSKPGADFIENLLRKVPEVRAEWLLLGDGPIFHQLNKASTTTVTLEGSKGQGQTIGVNHGVAAQHYNSVADCEKDLAVAQKEVELLRSQLQDKDLIIQLLRKQQIP